MNNMESSSFAKYGRVITGYPCEKILEMMKETPVPEDVVYVASVKELEALDEAKLWEDGFFGGMPMQAGYCNGHNQKLNAVEYHRNSEVNIAVTDMILMLGSQQDIKEDDTYDTELMEYFFISKGTAVELYATTLHYAPCHTKESGFQCVVLLPKGTNTEKPEVQNCAKEDRLLFAKNKWLIAHQESGLEKDGAFIGLIGENRTI